MIHRDCDHARALLQALYMTHLFCLYNLCVAIANSVFALLVSMIDVIFAVLG